MSSSSALRVPKYNVLITNKLGVYLRASFDAVIRADSPHVRVPPVCMITQHLAMRVLRTFDLRDYDKILKRNKVLQT